MRDDDELRRLRARDADTRAGFKPPPDPDEGVPLALVQTVTVSSYPAAAQAVYGVRRVKPAFTEVEGAAVTLTPYGPTFYAANVGTAVPPVGTKRLAAQHDGRWVFQYNG